MTSKKHGESSRSGSKNSSVSSRCVAIVFERNESDENNKPSLNEGDAIGNSYDAERTAFPYGQQTGQQTVDIGRDIKECRFNARTVFDEFRLRNKTCYWNPALVDSVASLEYAGFIEPTTLLVKGDDIHLENVRTAWGRRVLKDPAHYRITKIGDVNGIEMQEIPQTQFIPLPEALCLIILDLNNARVVATLDAVAERLKLAYQGLHLPSNQHVYDTLGQLIRERKVFHTALVTDAVSCVLPMRYTWIRQLLQELSDPGFGYFVVTPDTFRLHSEEPPSTYLFSPWTHLHPMYIPAAFSQPQKQATRSISCQADVEEESPNNKQPSIELVDDNRGTQMYPFDEKLKVDLPMPRVHRSLSLSLKSPSLERGRREERDGDRGTMKRSSSMKGRNEKKKSFSPQQELETRAESRDDKPKEKVSLLSKLFGRGKKKNTAAPPPPEPEKPAVEYATFSAQFPPPEWGWYQQQLDKQMRTQTWVQQQMVKSGTWHYLQSLPTNSAATGSNSLHFATNNSMPDRISPVQPPQAQPNMNFVPGVTRRSHKKSHKHKHRSALVIANTPQEMNGQDPADRNTLPNSMPSQNGLRLSSLPTRFPSSAGELGQSNYASHPMFNSTPRYRPSQEVYQEGDRLHQTAAPERKEHSSKHKSHKKGHRSKKKSHQDRHSSAYPMSRHISGMSAGQQWDEDISFDYQGRMPVKHSAVTMSHNSGVNCMGLGEEPSPDTTYQPPGPYRHPSGETTRKKDRVTHFEHDTENVRLKSHEYGRSKSYRHTVDENKENVHSKAGYGRSRSYRHPVSDEPVIDGRLARDGGDTGVHIYANVHVSNGDVRPKLPERTHRRAQDSLPESQQEMPPPLPPSNRPKASVQVANGQCPLDTGHPPPVHLLGTNESPSEGVTHSSSSSQERASQDSAVEGTESSEHSYGTVVNRYPLAGSKPCDRMLGQVVEMTLGDSGFSSPRVSENSKESRKGDCKLMNEQYVCNQLQTETKLNNSHGKLDECCSGDSSYGRITSDALYENVKINQREVLNNMRYLHKEINVSSQNLNRQGSATAEDGGPAVEEPEVEPKQAVVKKFNFSGDFHVVGVV